MRSLRFIWLIVGFAFLTAGLVSVGKIGFDFFTIENNPKYVRVEITDRTSVSTTNVYLGIKASSRVTLSFLRRNEDERAIIGEIVHDHFWIKRDKAEDTNLSAKCGRQVLAYWYVGNANWYFLKQTLLSLVCAGIGLAAVFFSRRIGELK